MTDKLDKLEARLDAIMDTLEGFKSEIKEIRSGGKIETVEVDDDNHQDDLEFISLEPVERAKIEDILKNFDFEKVHDVMEKLDWKWAMSRYGVPTIDEMKHEAKRLLEASATEKTCVATGGFKAVYEADESNVPDDNPYIGLEFILEECEGFVDGDGEDE